MSRTIIEMGQNTLRLCLNFLSFSITKPMKIVEIVGTKKKNMLPIGMNEPH